MRQSNDLKAMQQAVIEDITATRQKEAAESIAHKRAEAKRSEVASRQIIRDIEGAGLKISKLLASDLESSKHDLEEIETIEAQLAAESQEVIADPMHLEMDAMLSPAQSQIIRPVWSASFDDDDMQDEKTGVSALDSQAVLTGGGCKNYYNWAKGAGSGIAGTGVGQIQSWVHFGFWFKPEVTKFYSIIPLFRLRGYYIIKANDKWYNSKYARTKLTAWTNVHQYNWKGWNNVTLLNKGDDNINQNRRFDVDRYTYNSYLLGGGDWAFISCVIGLYAYARGDGSYVKNDFSTGNANYLCVPHCYVT